MECLQQRSDRRSRTGMARYFLRALLFVVLTSLCGAVAFAQDDPDSKKVPTPNTEPALYTYKVAHDHRIGKGLGELRITESGIVYRGESKDEERHSQVWRDDDIKRLEISKQELRITAYEAARVPIIPRQVPLSRGGASVRTGSERTHVFRLLEGEITPNVVRTLLARFKRPIATTVMPKEDVESG